MKTKIALFAALVGIAASPAVFAQATCATAVGLDGGNPHSIPGDSTAGTADIDEISVPLNGSKSVKYKFVAGSTMNGTLTITGATWPWAIYVASNCQASATLVNAVAHNDANPVLTFGGNGDTYTAGNTYYVIVAGAGDATADSGGPFVLGTTPTFPVTLSNFSID